ncbi:M56 family metallopeptidase [Algoriphagus litoralis]|uniref:M56 family metallopeptidase n=1 Tax=Algoriphagus litoralis TaxID=2202829 RepID=UPI000DB94132|nr:M56 family metallopeptidase [Algoriphagus litoralis]
MILYLLKSVCCLLILLVVHRLILQREAIYQFNRFYLLAAVIGSFLIPLVEIEVVEKEKQTPQIVSQEISPIQDFPVESYPDFSQESVSEVVVTEKPFDWNMLFWTVYGLVTLVFLIRFLRNIHLLFDKINRNVHVQFQGETLVLLQEQSLPFSFLTYIFVSSDYFEKGQLTDSIFAHEQAHVRGRHTWDNLLIEGLLVIFWFHPGLYLARQAIKLNHEFIADSAALQITPLEQYKTFLLAMMLPDQNPGLVSSLNFSLTKKRFEMMKRQTANSTKWIKILLVVPVLGALVYFFSEKVAAKAEENSELLVNTTGEENSKEENSYRLVYGSPIQNLTKSEYYSETKFTVKYPDGNSQEYSYDELPENFKKDLPNPPGEVKKHMPSPALFESWKNGDEYAIWIDGKVVPNSTLDAMEVSEIAHYSSSYVYPNARSERFPQNYQVQLYTLAGFENTYGKNSNFGKKPMGGTITMGSVEPKNDKLSFIPTSIPHQYIPTSSAYQKQATEFQLKISNSGLFTSPSAKEIEELRTEFLALDQAYFNLSMDERRKVSRVSFPYAKIEKDGQISYKKFELLTDEERKAIGC